MRLVIADYGMGNLRSVHKAFRRVGCDAIISADPAEIATADRLVLPGVGHFRRGMENLEKSGLRGALEQRVLGARVPLLGICLGLQLLTSHSEEGDCPGLGWIAGQTVRFQFADDAGSCRAPHIGWNTIDVARDNSLLDAAADGSSYYFTHSYHLTGCSDDDVVATAEYGHRFVAAIGNDNIWGTQFHPEKSHARGLAVLGRFLEAS